MFTKKEFAMGDQGGFRPGSGRRPGEKKKGISLMLPVPLAKLLDAALKVENKGKKPEEKTTRSDFVARLLGRALNKKQK